MTVVPFARYDTAGSGPAAQSVDKPALTAFRPDGDTPQHVTI
jgi:hypothetical protein